MDETSTFEVTEALRNARNAEAALEGLKEILLTWQISVNEEGLGEDESAAVLGQYEGWQAVLDAVGGRLNCVCTSLLAVMNSDRIKEATGPVCSPGEPHSSLKGA